MNLLTKILLGIIGIGLGVGNCFMPQHPLLEHSTPEFGLSSSVNLALWLASLVVLPLISCLVLRIFWGVLKNDVPQTEPLPPTSNVFFFPMQYGHLWGEMIVFPVMPYICYVMMMNGIGAMLVVFCMGLNWITEKPGVIQLHSVSAWSLIIAGAYGFWLFQKSSLKPSSST